MERINQLMTHPMYQKTQQNIQEAEVNRKFCRHGLEHALDVARILYIDVLEKNLPISKEVVYAAALLHDIGRYEQYEKDVPHHEAGALIAETILSECSFTNEEISLITAAIRLHKTNVKDGKDSLNALLYKADKLSRICFHCKAADECYWEETKKNATIIY